MNDKSNPEWTKGMLDAARPAKEVLPAEFFEGMKRARGERGKQKSPTKERVTLRVDPDVLDFFKKDGDGYQSRINEALRAYVNEHSV
jgi:uncharacterized protein (DUF4415 family)